MFKAKSIILLILAVVGATTFFWVGRFTAEPPRFEASAGDNIEQAWQDFIRAQNETLALMQATDFYGNDQEKAEAYRGVLYSLVGAIKSGALLEHRQPRFAKSIDWTSKSGMDNPDNNYFVALIDDAAAYRISGTRGTTKNLTFQLVIGQPGVGNAGTSTNVSLLNATEMHFEADGRYEIYVGAENPKGHHNWLKTAPGAEALLVRFSHSDWSTEQVGELDIELLGEQGISAAPLSTSIMAEKLRKAAVHLYDRNATWVGYSKMILNMLAANTLATARATQGGLVGQYSSLGNWDFGDDQAMIISVAAGNSSYQSIVLGNLWFVSLNYESRTSSFTLDQAYKSSDGLYHFVISHKDPGIQNWLDTEGHQRGLINLRWQGMSGPLLEHQQPSARLVPFAQLAKELPTDALGFDSEQRFEQIRARRKALHKRFQG